MRSLVVPMLFTLAIVLSIGQTTAPAKAWFCDTPVLDDLETPENGVPIPPEKLCCAKNTAGGAPAFIQWYSDTGSCFDENYCPNNDYSCWICDAYLYDIDYEWYSDCSGSSCDGWCEDSWEPHKPEFYCVCMEEIGGCDCDNIYPAAGTHVARHDFKVFHLGGCTEWPCE